MTASAVERGQRGVKRVLEKLKTSIESGNYYEAHQMYRTLYFRYTSQHKYAECLELLWSGAQQLLIKEQESCAVDLALLIIETLEHRDNTDDSDGQLWIERLGRLIHIFSASTIERETLINRAIKWSGEMSGKSLGDPTMHKLVGHVFWSEGNTEQARHHYLLCCDGDMLGRVLIRIHQTKGYVNEVDLFVVQAVLQQLCLKERETAQSTFKTYTTYHPQIRRKASPFRQPLLNFLHFLFLCLDLSRLDTFRALCDIYKPSLQRDPAYEKYLSKIGVLYFGAPPPQSNYGAGGGFMGGVFGDMITRLFQGLDDDNTDTDSEDPQNGNERTAQELD